MHKGDHSPKEDPIGIAGGLNLYGYANGDPINFSDPFGLSPWGKIIKLGVRGFKVLQKQVGEEALERAVREGEDVLMPSQQAARRLARRASDGADPIGPEISRGAGNRPHYHTGDRNGSHIFFSVAGALTFSNYVSDDASGIVKIGAGVLDFFNPLSIVNDGVEIYRALKPDENVPGGGS